MDIKSLEIINKTNYVINPDDDTMMPLYFFY